MPDKITKRSVDALMAPENGEAALWDCEVKGFGVRVRGGGVKTYVLVYRPGTGGRDAPKRRVTIGRHGGIGPNGRPWTPDTARDEARRLLGLIATGADPATDKSSDKKAETVADLGDRFLSDYVEMHCKPGTAVEYRRHVNKIIVPALGAKKVKAVTRADIARLHHGRRALPYDANRMLATLSKMFTLAEKWELRPDGSNPCQHVEKYPERKRERMLSGDELGKLGEALAGAERKWALASELDAHVAATLDEMKASGRTRARTDRVAELREQRKALGDVVSPQAVAALRLLVFTGARMGEVLGLRWEWIDLGRGVVRLPDSKTGAKTIHLAPPALAVLAALPRIEGNPHVIVGGVAGAALVNLEKPWRTIRKAAGLDDVRIHDLRHAFASVAAAAGLGLPIIGKMLGHTQAQTTARYAHLSNDPVAAAAATVASKIADAMNGRRADPGKPSAEVVEMPKRKA